MRAVIQAAIRQGGGGADSGAIGDDDNAAGRRLGADPRRRRSTGHTLVSLVAGTLPLDRKRHTITAGQRSEVVMKTLTRNPRAPEHACRALNHRQQTRDIRVLITY